MTVQRKSPERAALAGSVDRRTINLTLTHGAAATATGLTTTFTKQHDKSQLLVFASAVIYIASGSYAPGQFIHEVYVGSNKEGVAMRRVDDGSPIAYVHQMSSLNSIDGIAAGSQTVSTKARFNGPSGGSQGKFGSNYPASLAVFELPVSAAGRSQTGPPSAAIKAYRYYPSGTNSFTSSYSNIGSTFDVEKRYNDTKLVVIGFASAYASSSSSIITFALKPGAASEVEIMRRAVGRVSSQQGFSGANVITGLSAGTVTMQGRVKASIGTGYMNTSGAMSFLVVECL